MVQHNSIDHTGVPGVSSGSVATDAIWDAAGDLAVGSGANTAARLAIGATNGMALMRIGGAVAWAFPPGHQYDKVQITSSVNITATTEGTANTVVTANAVTFDGSTEVIIQAWFNSVKAANDAAGRQLVFVLYDDTGGGAAAVGQVGFIRGPSTTANERPTKIERPITPSAASHTYSLRAFVSAGTGVVEAGAGGSGQAAPGFIRITKV